jgi:hypothetical protein
MEAGVPGEGGDVCPYEEGQSFSAHTFEKLPQPDDEGGHIRAITLFIDPSFSGLVGDAGFDQVPV